MLTRTLPFTAETAAIQNVQTSAAPDDYEGKWHDYKITYTDGLITAYVDGEQIFEYTDSANPFGTIGFDGISVAYYVDDIRLPVRRPPIPQPAWRREATPARLRVELIPQLEGQDIFYTLDGSDPTDSAHGQYYVPESAIQIAKSATLKFRRHHGRRALQRRGGKDLYH